MFKRALAISMAFIGVIVGAGFASGQEAMQYFVAFGNWGLVGVVVASVMMLIAGVAMLQLGSYFQASEHTAVYQKISGPITSKILDVSTIVTLFSIGFVMFAGGGSNLNQQFPSIPIWAGATILLVLVILVGLLDVNKVTAVIGAITPFVIVFIVLATTYTIIQADVNLQILNTYATENVNTTLPNWWISALNYTGLNILCAVSMSIVIGGSILDGRAVGYGGIIGGFFYLLLLGLLVFSLYFVAADVNGLDMPVLELINHINPVLGYIMTFVIYGMIFNTAVGMFYALGKRLTRGKPRLFFPVYAASCVIGFALSFIGFQQLVGGVYPILGYMGLLMFVVLAVNWVRNRGKISGESERRMRARTLLARRVDPRKRFTKKNQEELSKLAKESNMDDDKFVETVSDEILDELEADDSLTEFDRDNPSSGVTYVEHTKPESAPVKKSDRKA
ncbi:MAG: hypothetical protein SOW59_01840 [Corynebacterium sp.]|nr:hypothetical protein [Corynebacterium sp.]